MNLNSRIEAITNNANDLLKQKKSDTIVLIVPTDDNEKGFIVDVCHHRSGAEDVELRSRLEACNTFDELTEELDGYATNVPGVKRSNEYK